MLKYRDCAVTSITDHVEQKSHVLKLLDAQNNSLSPGVSNPVKTNHMYGALSLFHNISESKPSTTIRPCMHVKDQKAKMEAVLLALLAEKSLSFTMTGWSTFG